MPLLINTNIPSLVAQRNLDRTRDEYTTALERLSSGLRINSAADDAAGLAISTRFQAQIRGNDVAIQNSQDGISLAQTAEGALSNITTSLQRIRELALRSANGTNGLLERQSLQEEVDQLKQEIANVAEKADFNGRNLLDGTFQDVIFQTGADVGETIEVNISETTADTLGTSVRNGLSSSRPPGNPAGQALQSGDLTINGFAVGAADAAADGASSTAPARSAISIVSAINAISDDTGVDAAVNATYVAATTVTASVSDTSGTVTLNGVDITLAGTGDADNLIADLQGVADIVNLNTGQTGVRAEVDVDNPGNGVVLIAEDGRNIDIADGTGTSTDYGLAAATTYAGTYTLVSRDGSDIVIGSNTGNSLENAGLEVGTYSGSNSGVSGGTVTGALTAGSLTINGITIGASLAAYDTASSTGRDGSAISIAEAINVASEGTGVTAVTNATQVTSSAIGAILGSATTITLNGVNITIPNAPTGSSVSEQISLAVSAVNDFSAQTGVRAEVVDDDQFQLLADDGRNIEIGGTVTGTGLTATVYRGSVSLVGAGQIEIGRGNSAGSSPSGLTVGVFGGAEQGTLIRDLDISTVAGAEEAIVSVDNALNQVSRARAELGAIQNRFEATIENLRTTNENLNASNSRIIDADFAEQTAELARTQVLQQAGISVLAQANAQTQQVLSLLQ